MYVEGRDVQHLLSGQLGDEFFHFSSWIIAICLESKDAFMAVRKNTSIIPRTVQPPVVRWTRQ